MIGSCERRPVVPERNPRDDVVGVGRPIGTPYVEPEGVLAVAGLRPRDPLPAHCDVVSCQRFRQPSDLWCALLPSVELSKEARLRTLLCPEHGPRGKVLAIVSDEPVVAQRDFAK